MNTLTLKFKKILPNAKLPTQAHLCDAGFDLYAVEDVTLRPHQVVKVRTGLALADMPERTISGTANLYLQFLGRSGLATKGVCVLGGVIDPTYRGELIVIMCNVSSEVLGIKSGDKCAQFIINQIITNSGCDLVDIKESFEETATARGTGGFGSTGA